MKKGCIRLSNRWELLINLIMSVQPTQQASSKLSPEEARRQILDSPGNMGDRSPVIPKCLIGRLGKANPDWLKGAHFIGHFSDP